MRIVAWLWSSNACSTTFGNMSTVTPSAPKARRDAEPPVEVVEQRGQIGVRRRPHRRPQPIDLFPDPAALNRITVGIRIALACRGPG